MSGESKGPFDAQKQLLSIGVSQRDLTRIRDITRAERHSYALGFPDGTPLEPHFFGGNRGLFSGNYQDRLETEILLSSPRITIEAESTERTGIFKKKTRIRKRQETKEIKPVDDIAQEIASYARELAAKDVQPVTIVDFGSGASITMARAAHILKEDIKAGKVRILATNIDTAPTEEDIPKIQRKFTNGNALNLTEAISEKTVTFKAADIVELYEMLKGDPVHLLFMVDMLPFTDEYNEALFKIVGEILDPKHGTAIFSYDKTLDDYPPGAPRLPVIKDGLAGLRRRGFTFHHPLQVADGEVRTGLPFQEFWDFGIDMYRGTDAPSLKLYTT